MTPDPSLMDQDRFAVLAAAYGARFDLWPAQERAGARAFLAERGRAAERLLFEARRLDAALAAWPDPTPSQAFIDRLVAAAPAPVDASLRFTPALAAGLAAACLCGAAAGVLWSRSAPAEEANLSASLDSPLDPAEVL